MSEGKKYPLVPLSEVLVQDKEYITELEPRLYPKLSVKLYGRGIVLDEPADGASVRMKRHQLAKPGQVILSEIWAKKGAIGIVPEEGSSALVTSHFFLFDIDESKLLRPYMGWLLTANYFEPMLSGKARGTTGYAAVRPKQFLECKIPLPSPDEQRRIVARIEELAALIEEAQALRVKAREEAEVLVNTQARKILSAVDTETTTLRDWLDPNRSGIQTGPFGSNLSSSDFVDHGVPVLTIGNVQYDGLHLDDLKHVLSEKAKELERYQIEEGDILFARMGTVGRCCVVPKEAEGWLINYHIIRVALDRSQVEPRFIHWTIQASADVSEYLDENIRGATRKGVNSKIVGSLPCRVPTLAQQRRIVAHLDGLQAQVDELTATQDATQAELGALLPSVLDQAFRGDL